MKGKVLDELLGGDYQSYQGLSKMSLKPTGMGLFMAKMTNVPMDIPIVPDEEDPTHMRYFAYMLPGVKFIIQFTQEEDGHIFVTVERTLFHKIK